MKVVSGGVTLLLLYAILVVPFSAYMRQRPIVEKIGYTPSASFFKYSAGDQELLVAESLVMRALFYFGTIVEINKNKIEMPTDYFGIYQTVENAVKLDPYNMDAYYFSQAILVWDVGRIEEANALLDYGMQYRTWDYMLPFFAGFNSAYFLHDYEKAAYYYRKASELSGVDLYGSLAGRYMYEAGHTDMALAYLRTMLEGARNEAVRESFATRIKALEAIKTIETALEHYVSLYGKAPGSVSELVAAGLLADIPVDPYGGTFFIDEHQRVRSTSKLAHLQKDDEGQSP